MNEEIQSLIDNNQYVNGTANEDSVIAGESRILFLSPQSKQHVLGRHQDEYAPGSLFNPGADFNSLIKSIVEIGPNFVVREDHGHFKTLNSLVISLSKPVSKQSVFVSFLQCYLHLL